MPEPHSTEQVRPCPGCGRRLRQGWLVCMRCQQASERSEPSHDLVRIARVRCPHREGLAYVETTATGDFLGCLPCECNDPVEVLVEYVAQVQQVSECRCQIVGWTRDPYEPHIPARAEWEQADDCPVHPLVAYKPSTPWEGDGDNTDPTQEDYADA